jgi:hypothetical protein
MKVNMPNEFDRMRVNLAEIRGALSTASTAITVSSAYRDLLRMGAYLRAHDPQFRAWAKDFVERFERGMDIRR